MTRIRTLSCGRMSIIILIPLLIALYLLFREPVQRVFLDVYLPTFMFLPAFYFWKVAALPPIGFSEAALLPIGLAILFFELPRWRVTPMDFCVGAFIFTSCYADNLADKHTAYIFDLFAAMTTCLVPYMIGKVLIEQHNARIATVKRFVFLLGVTCVISAYEYKMGQNPFALILRRFFPGETFAWKTQIRWGFGRVAGPFAQSELAGIILFAGVVFALYLSYYHLWEHRFRYLRQWPFAKSKTLVWLIAFTLLMTQARGPWLGALIAIPVALIGRSKHVLRRAMLTFAIVVIGGAATYVGIKHYVSGPTTSAEQENAQYRAQLITNYLPVVAEGGAWGWGPDFPRRGGQDSVDNEYLYVTLCQGYVGLAAFVLIAIQMVVRTFISATMAPTKPDRYFGWSMLGIELGLLFTVATVFLGLQAYELFFLLAGWSQALPLRPAELTQLSFESVYS